VNCEIAVGLFSWVAEFGVVVSKAGIRERGVGNSPFEGNKEVLRSWRIRKSHKGGLSLAKRQTT